jgi:alpha-tubulin suppressor-like RCC1 family protein
LGAGIPNPTLGLNASEMGDALPVVNLGAGRIAIDVSAAGHTCAVLQVGEIKCWGANEVGQLGQGDRVDRGQLPAQMGDALLPIDLGPAPWRRVVTGATHTCVLHSVGTVKCWGKNEAGELGQGDLLDRIGKPGELLDDVSVKPAHFALGLYAGQGLTCTKLDDQKLYCWGRGGHGQLGLDSDQPRGGVPKDIGSHMKAVLLPAGKRISDVAVSRSGHQVCARLSDGAGYRCWGSNLGHVVLPGAGTDENIGDAADEMGTLQPIDLGLAVP